MEYTIFTSLEEAKANGIENVREDVYALWRECFGDTEAYTDFYFEWVVPYNRILTLYREGKLCSMLHLNPYTLGVAGKEVKSDYIVGVATKADERRKGYMGLLIDRAFELMYEEERPFTYLMPAAQAIYYPYDFRIVYTQEDWTLELRKAAADNTSGSSGLQLLKLDYTDRRNRKLLTEFTSGILKREYDVYVLRSRKYYEKLLRSMESAGGGLALVLEQGKAVGYAAYMLEDGLSIAECICEPRLKKRVLKRLYEEYFPALKEEKDFKPSIMMRIVNLRVFLEGLRGEEEISLVIEASDARIHENNGIYRLVCGREESRVTPTQELPQLSGNVAELTRLFFGQMSMEEIEELIPGENKEEILSAISKIHLYKKNFINDVV